MLASTITIWAIITLGIIILFLAILDYRSSKENERLQNELNRLAKKLLHERKLKEQAEEALRAQVETQSNFIRTLPTTVLSGLKNKQESTTQSVQVAEQVFKGKSRKSEQLQSKKATPTLQSSKKLGATRLSSTKATTLKVGLRKGK